MNSIIWFFRKKHKEFFDHLKLYWVVVTYLASLVLFVFKVHHWPYQDELELIEVLSIGILIGYFYYHGWKRGYLLDKK